MADKIIVDKGGTTWRQDAEDRIFKGEDSKPVPGDASVRNVDFRVWLKDGDTWETTFRNKTTGETCIMASGTAQAQPKHVYCLQSRTRTTPDSNKPKLPIEPVEP